MPEFKVQFADGSYEVHTAHKVRRDGSGLYLLDESGQQIAAWRDGPDMPVACAPMAQRIRIPDPEA
jgi:hypothetical protein